jgi:hypothetical protein
MEALPFQDFGSFQLFGKSCVAGAQELLSQ